MFYFNFAEKFLVLKPDVFQADAPSASTSACAEIRHVVDAPRCTRRETDAPIDASSAVIFG